MRKHLRWFLTLFSVLWFGCAEAQTVDQLIIFAGRQFDQEQYMLAAREYQRALFFGPKEKVGTLNILTGDCYFEMGQFEQAELYYRFAATIEKDDSLKAEAFLKKASCNLFLGNYQFALIDLFNLDASFSSAIDKKKNVLLGIAYFGVEDFEKSKQYFFNTITEKDVAKKKAIDQLFQNKKLRKPNPKTAYWMSVVLPGLGQFYSGDIKNGTNSMILSLGLMVLTYRMAINQSILDGILTFFPWWQRYYVGGYNSASHIAKHKRSKNRAEIYQQIYSLILQ